MDIVVGLLLRAGIILLGVWVGVTITAGTALLVISFKRRAWPVEYVIECPNCDGMGMTHEAHGDDRVLDACPLCDGESALVISER